MKTRFIQHVGTRIFLRVYEKGSCPNCCGLNLPGYHDARIHLLDTDILFDNFSGGFVEDYLDDRWPIKCDHCGMPFSSDAWRLIYREDLYNTESGRPEKGDMYIVNMHGPNTKCHNGWTNCDGKHLYVVLPNGNYWDVDSRANNCTMRDEKTHRCWVRHGEPPNITVDKNGYTCQAGAGSIVSGSYHGFLINGELIEC